MPRRATTTVPGERSTPSASPRTAQATEAARTVRARRQQETANNPVCSTCGSRTIQNVQERARSVFWCVGCRRYPFGCGLGPDAILPKAANSHPASEDIFAVKAESAGAPDSGREQ